MQGWNYVKLRYKSLESVTKPKTEYKVENHMRLFINEITVIWTRKGVGRKKGMYEEGSQEGEENTAIKREMRKLNWNKRKKQSNVETLT